MPLPGLDGVRTAYLYKGKVQDLEVEQSILTVLEYRLESFQIRMPEIGPFGR